ncbi:MAG: UDP-3-O-acyl-N-acetylglucosamine deacetylase, partial [Pseudomonadota bacterium]
MEKIDFFSQFEDGMPIALGFQTLMDFFSSTDGYRVQKTLRRPCLFQGHGIHSGARTQIQLIPCEPNTGIVFLKKEGQQSFKIPAHFEYVTSTSLATSLSLKDVPESRVATVEHLLAALFALGINNLLIEVQGPEIPILDGSALPFVEGILDAGIEFQEYSSKILRILKPIKVYEHGAICELLPRKQLRLTTSIDFNHPKIGAQTFAMDLTPRAFADQIGCARTFGFLSDLEKLKSRNLALGASLDNVLGFSDKDILNSDGMRFSDECVRHKWLDALGDLALCGSWVEGELVSFRGGH